MFRRSPAGVAAATALAMQHHPKPERLTEQQMHTFRAKRRMPWAGYFDWQSSCPLPEPNTLGYRHRLRSAPRIVRPHSTASCTKSNAHSWFAPVQLRSGCPTRTQYLRFFRRIISPASR